jgi:farnesyl-diphosphate farnesyltransferase
MYVALAKKIQEQAAKAKKDALMADLQARGIIKARSPEEEARAEELRQKLDSEGAPWLMIIGVVVGVLSLMAGLGGAIVWFILKYYGDQ